LHRRPQHLKNLATVSRYEVNNGIAGWTVINCRVANRPATLPERSFMNNEIPAATNINVSLLS
jgi:hypothetical protein